MRHRMAGNWVKVYDEASVLRVERVIAEWLPGQAVGKSAVAAIVAGGVPIPVTAAHRVQRSRPRSERAGGGRARVRLSRD